VTGIKFAFCGLAKAIRRHRRKCEYQENMRLIWQVECKGRLYEQSSIVGRSDPDVRWLDFPNVAQAPRRCICNFPRSRAYLSSRVFSGAVSCILWLRIAMSPADGPSRVRRGLPEAFPLTAVVG
jgi:hypothetical protein